jgi:hypothetical protein
MTCQSYAACFEDAMSMVNVGVSVRRRHQSSWNGGDIYCHLNVRHAQNSIPGILNAQVGCVLCSHVLVLTRWCSNTPILWGQFTLPTYEFRSGFQWARLSSSSSTFRLHQCAECMMCFSATASTNIRLTSSPLQRLSSRSSSVLLSASISSKQTYAKMPVIGKPETKSSTTFPQPL